ncbi:MAG: hypothetical protein BWX80_02208 [Candidatus Hydrogenedentes bacterium ADurb.Bin101]|nr:MAG: hypothetical protein BWX80_02208 [Candidatus Hydrogenedentes bacterium ADurb.Bin101]
MRCYPEHNNILYESVIAQYGWNVKGILAVDSKCFEVKKIFGGNIVVFHLKKLRAMPR